MKRQFLTLFLTLLLLISIGGVVSIVGAASHVTPVQLTKTTVKEAAGPLPQPTKLLISAPEQVTVSDSWGVRGCLYHKDGSGR